MKREFSCYLIGVALFLAFPFLKAVTAVARREVIPAYVSHTLFTNEFQNLVVVTNYEDGFVYYKGDGIAHSQLVEVVEVRFKHGKTTHVVNVGFNVISNF